MLICTYICVYFFVEKTHPYDVNDVTYLTSQWTNTSERYGKHFKIFPLLSVHVNKRGQYKA